MNAGINFLVFLFSLIYGWFMGSYLYRKRKNKQIGDESSLVIYMIAMFLFACVVLSIAKYFLIK